MNTILEHKTAQFDRLLCKCWFWKCLSFDEHVAFTWPRHTSSNFEMKHMKNWITKLTEVKEDLPLWRNRNEFVLVKAGRVSSAFYFEETVATESEGSSHIGRKEVICVGHPSQVPSSTIKRQWIDDQVISSSRTVSLFTTQKMKLVSLIPTVKYQLEINFRWNEWKVVFLCFVAMAAAAKLEPIAIVRQAADFKEDGSYSHR